MLAKRTASSIFASISAPRNLQSVYEEYVFGSTSRGRDGVKPDSLQDAITPLTLLLSEQMRGGRYKFTTYRELLKTKGALNPPRVISVATARDRIVLKSISELLISVFPESKGKRPQLVIQDFKTALDSGNYGSYMSAGHQEFLSKHQPWNLRKNSKKENS